MGFSGRAGNGQETSMNTKDMIDPVSAENSLRAARAVKYNGDRKKLIDYLLLKVQESDWHGVSDAANDLRVMEAKHEQCGL